MANMCNNSVRFIGDPAAVENVKALFNEIQDKQEASGHWYLPSYVTANFSHMQDISVNDDMVNYETRWYPNLQGLIQIANHFQLDFVSYYDELANSVFGEASYTKGVMLDISLDPEDFLAYDFDPATRLFNYDDKTYENETPIFEEMIEQKKAANPYFKTTSTITVEELNLLYGELLTGDLLLKFAEHKNFDAARDVFKQMEEETVIQIDNFLINNHRQGVEFYQTQDKFIAVSFLKNLISEWDAQRGHKSYQTRTER